MGILSDTTLGKYARNIKAAPRPLIANKALLSTSALYAMTAIPLCWDQGSSSNIPSLPGFQKQFGITSATNPGQVSDFVSLVYIGCGIGAGLSFFINDRIGRLWSLRLYGFIWIIGQLIATGSRGHLGTMYAGRIIAGFGIGPCTVTGPMSLVEVAPTEIRGLITAWFSVVLLLSLFLAAITVYGCFVNMAASSLQWQVPFFAPTIAMTIVIVLSFFAYESPRWLFLSGQDEKATQTLVALRGLPEDHPRVQSELKDIREAIQKERSAFGPVDPFSLKGIGAVVKETFMVKANLRRAQQAMIAYAFAQLSGANSITTYLVPILSLVGVKGGTSYSLFVSAMYSMSKFFYTIIASFFFVDALGRRNSLFIGIVIQMLSHIYIAVFIKYNQEGPVPAAAGQFAIAAIFFHGFGYAVGLLVLPYVFSAELWPNQIRSFGSALTQCFHWLFFFGVNKGIPSLLTKTKNWGAFLFFAGWCLLAFVWVFLVVPETAGVEVEKLDALFEGPWWNQYKRSQMVNNIVIESTEVDCGSDSNGAGSSGIKRDSTSKV